MSILTKPARELFEKNVLNRSLHRKVGKELLSQWNIPLSITNDLLTLRRDTKSESDYILYHVMYAMDKNSLPKGYPPAHLKDELNQKYNDEKVEFPLEYEMIQIDDDQWIGKTTARELFRLSNTTLINYNENAQRLMKKIVSPSGEHYEYQTNYRAIDTMCDLIVKGRFIPNTITLNIPTDNKNDFYYDDRAKKIVIKKLKTFDILDGYHRLRAFIKVCTLDPAFDFPMELRITNYDDDRARQSIFQDFQRTNITKVDANSLNIYNAANIIVKKIQNNAMYGNIVAYNKGIINSPTLSQAITVIYKINPSISYKNSEIDKISKEIINGFDKFQEDCESIFDKSLEINQIYCLIYLIKQEIFSYKMYCDLYNKVNEAKIFKGHTLKQIDLKRMEELLKGGTDK